MQFLGFVGIVTAGAILLVFIFEFLNTERYGAEKVGAEVEPAVQSVATLPAFFAKLRSGDYVPGNKGLDDAVIAVLEEHVRSEQAIVTGFVHLPSFASLYRQTGSSQIML
jgi:hypothetical protein